MPITKIILSSILKKLLRKQDYPRLNLNSYVLLENS